MRIAYVEDNPTNLALVERVAGMNRHIIVSYTEGEIALQELKHELFDLILMDVELAGDMGGLEVVRKLRMHGLQTPIVAVTAYAMTGDRDKCIEAGCTDYLSKPLPIPQLIALLNRYDEITRQTATSRHTPATVMQAKTPAQSGSITPAQSSSAPTSVAAPVEIPKETVAAKPERHNVASPVDTSVAKSEPSQSAPLPDEVKSPKPT